MAGFSSDPVKTTDEEERVRTEEAAPAKTTDEEEDVRTEEDDAVKNVDEQRVRTEEVPPAKTTEEEEDVRTEEDDSVKRVEEEDVRTEEADRAKTADEEEAIESLLDSALNLDEESEERNENAQEDSTMIPTSDQLTNIVIQRPNQNPRLNQIPRSDQMMIASVQPFGVQPPKPVWCISDHSFTDGFGPNTVAWRPQTIRPNQTTSQDRQHPMANELANIAWLQDQMFVPKPLFVTTLIFNFVQQPHLTCYNNRLVSPEANHQNLMMPRFKDDQILTLTSPSGEPRRFLVLPYNPYNSYPLDPRRKCVYALDDAVVYAPSLEQTPYQFYQGPHLFFPMDRFQCQAFRNHQQRQQHQTRFQFWRFNAGGSSRQGQDQQQP